MIVNEREKLDFSCGFVVLVIKSKVECGNDGEMQEQHRFIFFFKGAS